jgi:chromosome partitioning protein
MALPTAFPFLHRDRHPHIIVVGNEKGGAGKTTVAMHLVVSLLRLGFRVATLDVDIRQGSLHRYLQHRKNFADTHGLALPCPTHYHVPTTCTEHAAYDAWLTQTLEQAASHDMVVIDTPGSDHPLSRLAHARADTIVTPLNDSFVDVDVLATVQPGTGKIERPGIYSQMVWEQKMRRAAHDGGMMDWVVMRNRMASIESRNQRQVTTVLQALEKRVGCRIAPGFSERVIFRALFLQGITLPDIRDHDGVSRKDASVTLSHIAARQELRQLLRALQIGRILRAMEAAAVRGNTPQTEEVLVPTGLVQSSWVGT